MLPPSTPNAACEGPVEAAVRTLVPLLMAARESTSNTPFSFSKDAISVFLGRL